MVFLDGAWADCLPDHTAIVDMFPTKLDTWNPQIPKESCDNVAFHARAPENSMPSFRSDFFGSPR